MSRAPSRTATRPKTPAAPPTTRSTRATAAKTASAPAEPPPKKTTTRKPLVSKDNATETSANAPAAAKKPKAVKKPAKMVEEEQTENIMAYLRLRPPLGDDEPTNTPYLLPLSESSVRMTDPNDPHENAARFRMSAATPSSIYKFSKVFLPATAQSDFFTKTTLPLVRDVLQGQNGLLFAYGVTNSGKTYTVQGGKNEGSAGILPRSLDVIFNSIEGLHGSGKYRPVRLQGVELADKSDSAPPPVAPAPGVAEVLGQHMDAAASDADIDPTVLTLDRNYEYTIWISYAEVYNEKVYDLLDNVQENPAGGIPRSNSGKSLLLTRKALPLKPSPLSDSPDSGVTGKYISGLRQFRVHSAAQAKGLIKLGQLHRRVFGTLANRESSRSHGMVIIKVVRGHRGERDDPTSLQIARLTLVDLAGSERTKHTQTTGDRLREAGNINKSLMVLGQCMEVLRSNQRKLAISLGQDAFDGRMDTRDVKRGLALVPFRHSKLTEILMDYFVGDSRAVMIVNVNPYDTGYDENSHVMKFSALAREVYVTPAPVPAQRVPGKSKQAEAAAPKPYRRKVTISTGGPGERAHEAVLEVLEEDEADGAGSDEDDEPINPLVDALFDEVEQLRMQLYESEMRCAIIEAEVREEVMKEMEERMAKMEKMYTLRIQNEVTRSEEKTDAKIDMLHQSGLFASPVKRPQQPPPRRYEESDEEEDVETSLMEYGTADETSDDDESERARSESPLAGKRPAVIREVRKFIPDPPMLPSDAEDAAFTESENESEEAEEESDADSESVADSGVSGSEVEDEDYQEHVTDDDDEEDEDELMLSPTKTPRAKPRPIPMRVASPTPAPAPRVSKLTRELRGMKLAESEAEESDAAESTTGKRKKRQLGKKKIVTEEEVERAIAKADQGRPVRRMTGRY
ncbi:Kinesin-like protein [Mycena indigotica]|uniref:Kinesin-like protein n=1 Tax=Mycena indigotica TaxID=2126181 RepID=A0A8H6SXB6_9AGAR|nr:Kinesin-like protein [Mycena indigotica]KAF7306532.1 Kinesin-like protein [Mycena indigotica]